MRFWLALLAAVVLWQGLHWWQQRPVHQPDGVLAPLEPEQVAAPESAAIVIGGFSLLPQAHYRITARLLSIQHYRFGRDAELSPLDFALGWGPMSDNRVLQALELSQSGRFFWLHWAVQPPLPETVLFTHASNTHLIPATAEIGRQLARMRAGQVVTLDGQLVNVTAADGWYWHTSLTRSDQGAGACELMLVQVADVFLRGS